PRRRGEKNFRDQQHHRHPGHHHRRDQREDVLPAKIREGHGRATLTDDREVDRSICAPSFELVSGNDITFISTAPSAVMEPRSPRLARATKRVEEGARRSKNGWG